MTQFFLLALANATIVITITKGSIFKGFREGLHFSFFKKLYNCSYCFSHYTSFILTLTLPYSSFFDFIINVFALNTVTSLFAFPLLLYLNTLDST